MGTTRDLLSRRAKQPDQHVQSAAEFHFTTHDGGWLRDGVATAAAIELSSREVETP